MSTLRNSGESGRRLVTCTSVAVPKPYPYWRGPGSVWTTGPGVGRQEVRATTSTRDAATATPLHVQVHCGRAKLSVAQRQSCWREWNHRGGAAGALGVPNAAAL